MTNSQNNNDLNENHDKDIVLENMDNEQHDSHDGHRSHSHHSSHSSSSHKRHKKRKGHSNDKMPVVTASGRIKYKRRPKHRSKKQKLKLLRRVVLCIILLLAVTSVSLFTAFKYFSNKGKEELLAHNENVQIDNKKEDAQASEDGQTIIYNGETYRYNKDLISIVILGVDQSELNAEEYGYAGQADAIYIFTYDINSKKCNLIPVSRETMTEVRLYSTSGKEMGLKNMQVCLAYAYGNGKDTSCSNTLEALSKIFYNIPFSTYLALNWDVIAPLNDAIGGVTLTSLEDIETPYSTIAKDEKITLLGQDAWSYIKYRNTSKLDSNPARLNRQKQYINAYVSKLLPLVREDFSIIPKLYDTASEYMYTNVNRNKFLYIASEVLPNLYSSKEINFISIDGELKQGEEHAEFYPDETSLFETILNVFYVKEIN